MGNAGITASLIFGTLLIVVGINIVIFFPIIYDHVFNSLMEIYPGSYSYDIWKDLPVPMQMKIYFWNVSNANEIEARLPGVKPIMKEIGPYVFEEHHYKDNEQWSPEEVTYYQAKTWYFNRGESIGELTDEITNINMVAASAAEYARHEVQFYAYVMNDLFQQEQVPLFMTASVRNLTFDGVLDEIMSAMETFPPFIVIPIPFDKFGWFYPRNGSLEYDGNLTMYTGQEDILNVGQIKMWNGMETIRPEVFPGHCGELRGSAGDFFPAKAEKTFQDFFSPDLCRSIRFHYTDQTDVLGVHGYRYTLDQRMVGNASFYPENSCFNPFPADDFYLPNGLLNVSTCKFDAPAYVSFPHFYLADSDLIYNQFNVSFSDFTPNEELHASSLSLQPDTGVPLDVKVRMQINGLIRPINISDTGEYFSTIELFDDLEPTFYPLLWFETTASLTPEYADMLKLVTIIKTAVPTIGIVLIVLGTVLGLLGIYWLIHGMFHRKRIHNKEMMFKKEKMIQPFLKI